MTDMKIKQASNRLDTLILKPLIDMTGKMPWFACRVLTRLTVFYCFIVTLEF